jgi:hypothetical protein
VLVNFPPPTLTDYWPYWRHNVKHKYIYIYKFDDPPQYLLSLFVQMELPTKLLRLKVNCFLQEKVMEVAISNPPKRKDEEGGAKDQVRKRTNFIDIHC